MLDKEASQIQVILLSKNKDFKALLLTIFNNILINPSSNDESNLTLFIS